MVRFDCNTLGKKTIRQKSMTDKVLQNDDFTIFKTRNEYL